MAILALARLQVLAASKAEEELKQARHLAEQNTKLAKEIKGLVEKNSDGRYDLVLERLRKKKNANIEAIKRLDPKQR